MTKQNLFFSKLYSLVHSFINFLCHFSLFIWRQHDTMDRAWGFNTKPGLMQALSCFQLVRWPWASDLSCLRNLQPCRETSALLLSVQSCCDWFILNKSYLLLFSSFVIGGWFTVLGRKFRNNFTLLLFWCLFTPDYSKGIFPKYLIFHFSEENM